MMTAAKRRMPPEWVAMIVTMSFALTLGLVGWQIDSDTLRTLSLFLGTVGPASFLALDLADRYMSVPRARIIRWTLLGSGVIVVASIIASQVTNNALDPHTSWTFSVAIWGMMILGMGLSLVIPVLAVLMAMQYAKVASGRRRAFGLLLIGLGGFGLVLPLQFADMTDMWPWIGIPAMVIAFVGRNILDAARS
jgi:MFS family permease